MDRTISFRPVLAALVVAALAAMASLAGLSNAEAAGGLSPSPKKVSCPDGWSYNKRCKSCGGTCKKGWSWHCRTKTCVKQSSLNLNDDELYKEAVSLIEGGQYIAALETLWSIGKRDNPEVLTYIGYSTRKLGNVDGGIVYYKKALALDPNHNRAREYLGEGYLQKGDLESAKKQLSEISKRCGTDCREYRMLANAIVHHVTGVKPDDAWQ